MRKNLFRSILMASLMVTAIGGLNSCKDYDDDIAELRQEIKTNSNDLNSLVADKVNNLTIEAAALKTELSNLESAYKTADAALQTKINDALASGQAGASTSYVDSKATAAEQAAKSYADIKAAEAQSAAIAAATKLVNDASTSLSNAVAAAEAKISEQGNTIAGLLQADKELQQGINTATARANEAYTLANQAMEAAKAAQAKAEAAQGAADEAKTQAAKTASDMQVISDNLKAINETLTNQINVFGVQVTAAQTQAAENKAKIEAQAAQLAEMKSANDRVQSAIDALGTKVNDQISALNNLISNNQTQIALLQIGLDTVTKDVEVLKGQVSSQNDVNSELRAAIASLLTADSQLEGKINSAIAEANSRLSALTTTVSGFNQAISDATQAAADNKTAIDNNAGQITKLWQAIQALQIGDIDKLQEALDGLKSQYEGLEEQFSGHTSDLEKIQGVIDGLDGQFAALDQAIAALASTSTTQADIDKAIAKLSGTVGGNYDELKGMIESLQGGIPTAAAIAQAAEAAANTAANSAVAALIADLEAGKYSQDISGIQAQLSSIQNAYADIDKNIQEQIAAAIADIDIEDVKATLKGELEEYIKSLVDGQGQGGEQGGEQPAESDASLQAQIDELAEILYAYLFGEESEDNVKRAAEDAATSVSAIQKLKDAIGKASGATTAQTILSSITLIPDLYINGIEAIQFLSLEYKNHTFDKTVENQGPAYKRSLVENGDFKNVDNGLTTAFYRLSPMTVTEDDIVKDGVTFWSKTARTETRSLASDAGLKENTPIKPVNVEIENGILAVQMEKTVSSSLYFKGEGEPATLVSLMVPRADGTADIYSEFSLIDEDKFNVHIAAANIVDDRAWKDYHQNDASKNGHYAGYKTVYGTDVDDATYIKKWMAYDKTYDLLSLVVGCDDDTHAMYTVDQLKSFGLTFEFSIPTDPYTKNAPNGTDQQQFAKIEGTKISSKLPNGVTNNKAAVDKAPIVRVLLKHGSEIVDEAYFKIQWVAKVDPPTPDLPDLELDPVWKYGVLSCDEVHTWLIWKDFINNVYGASFENAEGEIVKPDLSYDEFREIYPASDITTKLITPGLTSSIVVNTSMPDEDAQVAKWSIQPDEFGKILPERSKVVEAQIIFKSSKPKEYPTLILPFKFKVQLPEKPAVNGYNTNYWFQTGEKLYVLPVQYNTKDASGAIWTTEVKYDYNVMQAFVTSTATTTPWGPTDYGTYLNWIVKNIMGDCGTWDMQFAKTQSAGSAYHPAYTTSEPLTDEGVAFNTFGAYQFQKDLTTGIRFNWMNASHASWQNKETTPFAVMNATPADKDVVKDLLNDLSDENEADGWTPKKTYDDKKAIDIKIFNKYNAFNCEEITSFKAYLVTPIRINHSLNGAFENGHISGTVVDAMGSLNMTDFRGYLVRKTAPTASEAGVERTKWTDKLYTYYGLSDPTFDIPGAKFGLKIEGGNVVKVDEATLSAAEIEALTAGGMAPSLEEVGGKLVYKNMGGHEPDFVYNVYVPVTIKHAFGEKTSYIAIPIYPKGQAAGDGYKYGMDGEYVKLTK